MNHFAGYFAQELKRSIISLRFILCSIGVFIIHLLSVWWDIQASYSSVAYYYFVARVMGIENLFLVLTVIPGALTFQMDMESTFARMVLNRCSKLSYLISKTATAFASAALVSVFGDAMFIGGLSIFFPIWDTSFSNQVNAVTIWDNHAMYFLYYMLIRAFGAAFFSLVTLVMSLYVQNVFVVLSVPIAGYYLWETISDFLQFPSWMDIRHLLSGTALGWESVDNMLFSLAAFLLLSVLMGVYFIYTGRRRLSNG